MDALWTSSDRDVSVITVGVASIDPYRTDDSGGSNSALPTSPIYLRAGRKYVLYLTDNDFYQETIEL